MGDRALIIFIGVYIRQGNVELDVSPICYTHWSGQSVPDYIKRVGGLMSKDPETLNLNNAGAAAFAFCGMMYEEGNKSGNGFRCWNTPAHVIKAIEHIFDEREVALIKTGTQWADGLLANYSHGDRGLYVVDCRDFSWEVYDGADEVVE
jgi:hypothetical protein